MRFMENDGRTRIYVEGIQLPEPNQPNRDLFGRLKKAQQYVQEIFPQPSKKIFGQQKTQDIQKKTDYIVIFTPAKQRCERWTVYDVRQQTNIHPPLPIQIDDACDPFKRFQNVANSIEEIAGEKGVTIFMYQLS